MRVTLGVVVVLVAVFVGGLAMAEEGALEPVSPPVGSQGGYMNFFGQDVDIDPSTGTIVVGAYGHGPSRAGAAWVIEWDGRERVFTRLQPQPPPHPARAGSAVAIEGDLIAVGAPLDGRVVNQGGAVYLFRKTDEEWQLETVLAPADLEPNDWFGFHLDIDGGRVVVGATNDADSNSAGRVFVFRQVDGEWASEVIQPAGGRPGDYFGIEVHLDGDLLVVGADGVDGEFRDEGAVYLYRYRDGTWLYEDKIEPLDPFDYLYFGVRIHGDGERIAVTAAGNFDHSPDLGRVHLLTPGADGWVQTIAFAGDPTYANLGTSVVIDGGTIYVGALGAYNYLRQIGQVLVLEEGLDGWVMVDKLTGPTKYTTENGFGWSAAGTRDALVIGAPGYRPNGEGSGEIYVRVEPRCGGMVATILGSPDDDVISGTPGIDVILAGSGNDIVRGLSQDDVVCSGPGYDLVSGDGAAHLDLSARDWVVVDGAVFADGYRLV